MVKAVIRNKKLFLGLVMVSILILVGIFAYQIMPYGYDQAGVGEPLKPPSKQHWFGTDILGRDIFSRVIYGARVSLLASIGITLGSLILGIPIGLVSGYYGGAVDNICMRFMDVLFSFPWVLMGLFLAAIRGPGLSTVMIALTLTYFPQVARIVRSSTLSLKEQDFVIMARLNGENGPYIMFRYILPNCLAPLVVQTTVIMSFSILGEAALSFLGYGTRQPVSSWGIMLQQATEYIWTARYLIIFPGLFILFAVLGFNFMGDGLRDILDPRYRRIYGI